MDTSSFSVVADRLENVDVYGDRVLLRVHGIETEGTIVMPEKYQSKYFSVAKIGEGFWCPIRKENVKPKFKVGDVVWLEAPLAIPVKVGGKTFVMADVSNVMCSGTAPEPKIFEEIKTTPELAN